MDCMISPLSTLKTDIIRGEKMAFEEMKIEDSDLVGKQISELADVPELSADDLKKRFDSISKDVIIPKFNLLLLGLVAESAAASIGITPPDWVSADANIAAVVAAISAAVKTNTESRHSHENKVTLDSLTSSVIEEYNRIVTLLKGISSISNQVSDDENTVPTGRAIVDYVTELGGGDMLKSVYDANGNGVVDDSEKLGGKLPTYYQPSTDNTLNTSSKSVSGAINEVYSMAKNGGKQLVGDEFDPEREDYVKGDLCIKDNVLYKFTAAKTEKGWDASKVVATTVDAELQSLNTKIIPVTFLAIMENSYVRLYQSGEHIKGLLFATNSTPKNKISVKTTEIAGIGNASSVTYYYVPVASVLENPFGLHENQYTCVGLSLDRANSSSGSDLSVVPSYALALYNGTNTILYCSVGGGSTTYNTTRYLIWIDYVGI